MIRMREVYSGPFRRCSIRELASLLAQLAICVISSRFGRFQGLRPTSHAPIGAVRAHRAGLRRVPDSGQQSTAGDWPGRRCRIGDFEACEWCGVSAIYS